LWSALSLGLRYLNYLKASKLSAIFLFFAFLLVATPYFPEHLARKLESKYGIFDPNAFPQTDTAYITVLGSGYSLDHRLPAIGQLGLSALGRLAEGVRIKKVLSAAYLVTTGHSAFGVQTQASVARQAAIELGISPDETKMLETPSNTWEEAEAFKNTFGQSKKVILVTDAIHMKRAKSFFERFGMQVFPAPTNFKVHESINESAFKFMPSTRNINLMESVLREYLGEWKVILLK
jgi:uncharacterized SAM-binding protein YcdF (DUF218 family)